jgi:hypothetical protein
VLWTFVGAWVFRLAIALAMGSFHNLDRRDMERLALSLVHTGSIANMMVPGLPSAGESPGYVIFLAGIFRLFGDGVPGEVVKVLACITASSLRGALAVWLAARLGLGRTAILATAVLSVFWIGGLNTELQGDWDPPYTAAALIVLVWLQISNPFERRSLGRCALLGALWALCGYLNFSVLAVLGGFLVRDLWRHGRREPVRFARQAACIGLASFLVLLPWGIRNRIVLGSCIFSRTMLGYGISLSYHDGASAFEPINNHPSYLLPGHPEIPEMSPYPFLNPNLRPEVAHLGEVEWDRERQRQGLAWIERHPGESLGLFAQHVFYYWFSPSPNLYSEMPRLIGWPYTIAKWMLTLLAASGWWRLRKISKEGASALGIIAFWFPLVYYVVNWSSRYRMPMEWVLVLLAGVAVAAALKNPTRSEA